MPFFERNFLEEDVTIQDLETLKKVELDALIKKYGQRRRFARVLIQWISKRGLPVDPELLMLDTHFLSFCSLTFFNLLLLLFYIYYFLIIYILFYYRIFLFLISDNI